MALETKANRSKHIEWRSGPGKTKKLVLAHNHNDSNAKTKNKVGKTWEAGMETAQRLRAMARSVGRVPRFILTEAGNCSPRQNTGSIWRRLLSQQTLNAASSLVSMT
ncbi:hypothetical protein [Bradyrhizobium lupini]